MVKRVHRFSDRNIRRRSQSDHAAGRRRITQCPAHAVLAMVLRSHYSILAPAAQPRCPRADGTDAHVSGPRGDTAQVACERRASRFRRASIYSRRTKMFSAPNMGRRGHRSKTIRSSGASRMTCWIGATSTATPKRALTTSSFGCAHGPRSTATVVLAARTRTRACHVVLGLRCFYRLFACRTQAAAGERSSKIMTTTDPGRWTFRNSGTRARRCADDHPCVGRPSGTRS